MVSSDNGHGDGPPTGPGARDLASARVVVVDDQPANVALLERILRASGVGEVLTITDPTTAVERCMQVGADMLLLDLHMPVVDGFAIMTALADAVPADALLPVVVLTADITPETRRAALAAGALDFLTKPFDHNEVELRVRNLLRTKRLHDQVREQRADLEVRVAERTAELAKANEELLALDRMKRDFIAMASHEMRTPLTVLTGFTQLLTRRWEHLDQSARSQQVEALDRNLARLQRLVDNLVQAAAVDSRGEDAEIRRDVPLLDVRGALADAVRDSPVHTADVVVHCPPDLHVQANAEPIHSVLTNLLTNADKYAAPPIVITAQADDEWLEVTVRDHGPGVPQDFTDRLFEQFSQASVGDRRTATGTGLGLWIARGLAGSHGGQLTFEPARPGSIFRLRLPHRRRIEKARSQPADQGLGQRGEPPIGHMAQLGRRDPGRSTS